MAPINRLMRGLLILGATTALSACTSMIPPIDIGLSRPGGHPLLVKARLARFAFAPVAGPPAVSSTPSGTSS